LMKIIGALSIIAGIIALASVLYDASLRHDYSTVGANLFWTIGPILSGIFWWAIAELMYVFIDIEYNTRRLAIVEPRVVPPSDIAAD